jgi:hypothetical protein
VPEIRLDSNPPAVVEVGDKLWFVGASELVAVHLQQFLNARPDQLQYYRNTNPTRSGGFLKMPASFGGSTTHA